MQTSAAADTCPRLIDRSQKPGQRWRRGSVCADADEQPRPLCTCRRGKGGSAKASSGCFAEHHKLAASKQQEFLSHDIKGQKSKIKVSEGQAPSQASSGGSPPSFFQLLPAPSNALDHGGETPFCAWSSLWRPALPQSGLNLINDICSDHFQIGPQSNVLEMRTSVYSF